MPELDLDEFMDVENETELTLCNDCLFWKQIEEDHIERCWKNAPRPGINSSLDSQTQEVVWPATKASQGCFEGIAKSKVMLSTDEEMDDTVCKNNVCGHSCARCVERFKDAKKNLHKTLAEADLKELTKRFDKYIPNEDDELDSIIENDMYDNL